MNQWTLTFPACVDHSAHDEIAIEIDLVSGTSPVTVGAKLDSGSKFCVFQPRYAKWLGFDLTCGIRERIRTAAGSFPAYGMATSHEY
jgi:hypothetical protein